MFGAKPAQSSLFGSTSTPTGAGGGGSLFGNTASSGTATGGSLFGSTPAKAGFGTPSGGLFGSTTTSTASGGGGSLFGNTATSGTTTGGSLFGSTPASGATTGGSLFGSNQATGTQSGGLFGSTSTATGGGGSLFGNTGTSGTSTGGSLFGSNQTAAGFGTQSGGLFGSNTQQQQQGSGQIQLTQIVQDAIAIRTSITEPKLYGDDSDITVLRLNQLLAACGVGSGWYEQDKPAASYDSSNPFFQFRAIGYCALSRHKDSDGIVALILSQSADSLSTAQERQKLLDSLYAIFGSNPDVHAHIFNIRPLTEKLCEVEIYVTKVGSGKINAKDLFAYLDHPDRTKTKQEKLPQCEKIVPRVEMSQDDIKRYLSSPPKGFSESEWRNAIIENPDQQNLLPYPIYGYKDLDDRRQRQLKERDVQRKSLGNLNDRLKTATQHIQQINGLKKIFHEDAKRLRHRILRIIAATHNNSYQTAVTIEEEQLLSRLETIVVCINAPNRLHHRIEKLHAYLDSNKEALENRKKEADDHQTFSEEESAALKRYLTRRQQDLDIISESLKNDMDDAKIMLKEQF